jgi:hypothetical protein
MTYPVSLRIAARIKPSMMALTTPKIAGTQFHNIDTLGHD